MPTKRSRNRKKERKEDERRQGGSGSGSQRRGDGDAGSSTSSRKSAPPPPATLTVENESVATLYRRGTKEGSQSSQGRDGKGKGKKKSSAEETREGRSLIRPSLQPKKEEEEKVKKVSVQTTTTASLFRIPKPPRKISPHEAEDPDVRKYENFRNDYRRRNAEQRRRCMLLSMFLVGTFIGAGCLFKHQLLLENIGAPPTAVSFDAAESLYVGYIFFTIFCPYAFALLVLRLRHIVLGFVYMFFSIFVILCCIRGLCRVVYSLDEDWTKMMRDERYHIQEGGAMHDFYNMLQHTCECCGFDEVDIISNWPIMLTEKGENLPTGCLISHERSYRMSGGGDNVAWMKGERRVPGGFPIILPRHMMHTWLQQETRQMFLPRPLYRLALINLNISSEFIHYLHMSFWKELKMEVKEAGEDLDLSIWYNVSSEHLYTPAIPVEIQRKFDLFVEELLYIHRMEKNTTNIKRGEYVYFELRFDPLHPMSSREVEVEEDEESQKLDDRTTEATTSPPPTTEKDWKGLTSPPIPTPDPLIPPQPVTIEPLTTPAPSIDCSDNKNGKVPDPLDCAQYYECDSQGQYKHHRCAPGEMFVPKRDTCMFTTIPCSFCGTADWGNRRYQGDCRSYMKCDPADGIDKMCYCSVKDKEFYNPKSDPPKCEVFSGQNEACLFADYPADGAFGAGDDSTINECWIQDGPAGFPVKVDWRPGDPRKFVHGEFCNWAEKDPEKDKDEPDNDLKVVNPDDCNEWFTCSHMNQNNTLKKHRCPYPLGFNTDSKKCDEQSCPEPCENEEDMDKKNLKEAFMKDCRSFYKCDATNQKQQVCYCDVEKKEEFDLKEGKCKDGDEADSGKRECDQLPKKDNGEEDGAYSFKKNNDTPGCFDYNEKDNQGNYDWGFEVKPDDSTWELPMKAYNELGTRSVFCNWNPASTKPDPKACNAMIRCVKDDTPGSKSKKLEKCYCRKKFFFNIITGECEHDSTEKCTAPYPVAGAKMCDGTVCNAEDAWNEDCRSYKTCEIVDGKPTEFKICYCNIIKGEEYVLGAGNLEDGKCKTPDDIADKDNWKKRGCQRGVKTLDPDAAFGEGDESASKSDVCWKQDDAKDAGIQVKGSWEPDPPRKLQVGAFCNWKDQTKVKVKDKDLLNCNKYFTCSHDASKWELQEQKCGFALGFNPNWQSDTDTCRKEDCPEDITCGEDMDKKNLDMAFMKDCRSFYKCDATNQKQQVCYCNVQKKEEFDLKEGKCKNRDDEADSGKRQCDQLPKKDNAEEDGAYSILVKDTNGNDVPGCFDYKEGTDDWGFEVKPDDSTWELPMKAYNELELGTRSVFCNWNPASTKPDPKACNAMIRCVKDNKSKKLEKCYCRTGFLFDIKTGECKDSSEANTVGTCTNKGPPPPKPPAGATMCDRIVCNAGDAWMKDCRSYKKCGKKPNGEIDDTNPEICYCNIKEGKEFVLEAGNDKDGECKKLDDIADKYNHWKKRGCAGAKTLDAAFGEGDDDGLPPKTEECWKQDGADAGIQVKANWKPTDTLRELKENVFCNWKDETKVKVVVPGNCKKYYTCLHDDNDLSKPWQLKEHTCGFALGFNPAWKTQTDDTCIKEGCLDDLTCGKDMDKKNLDGAFMKDCRSYYKCDTTNQKQQVCYCNVRDKDKDEAFDMKDGTCKERSNVVKPIPECVHPPKDEDGAYSPGCFDYNEDKDKKNYDWGFKVEFDVPFLPKKALDKFNEGATVFCNWSPSSKVYDPKHCNAFIRCVKDENDKEGAKKKLQRCFCEKSYYSNNLSGGNCTKITDTDGCKAGAAGPDADAIMCDVTRHKRSIETDATATQEKQRVKKNAGNPPTKKMMSIPLKFYYATKGIPENIILDKVVWRRRCMRHINRDKTVDTGVKCKLFESKDAHKNWTDYPDIGWTRPKKEYINKPKDVDKTFYEKALRYLLFWNLSLGSVVLLLQLILCVIFWYFYSKLKAEEVANLKAPRDFDYIDPTRAAKFKQRRPSVRLEGDLLSAMQGASLRKSEARRRRSKKDSY